MGLWNNLKVIAWEANEDAHSSRLQNDFGPTINEIQSLPDELRTKSLIKFLSLREQFLAQRNNWSRRAREEHGVRSSIVAICYP
jgi:hypothetical protein